MIRGAKEAALAGALTFSGLGIASSPAIGKTDSPRPITQDIGFSRGPALETPTLIFNQEAYTPNNMDGGQIQDIANFFLEAGANPDFLQQMTDRYFNEFDQYFDIHKAPLEFRFQYSPFGKDNPVLIDFFATDQPAQDPQFTETANVLQIIVGDDGTLLSPRSEVVTFPLEDLPKMIDENFTGVRGIEGITWETDFSDPSRETMLTQSITPMSITVVTGDTQGYLFYGTRFLTPASEQ